MFKIESDTTDPMIVLQHFLQKYTSLYTREEWKALFEDIEFVENTPNMCLPVLKFRVAKFIQEKVTSGLWPTMVPIALVGLFITAKIGKLPKNHGTQTKLARQNYARNPKTD
jgi:hypothetical protein